MRSFLHVFTSFETSSKRKCLFDVYAKVNYTRSLMKRIVLVAGSYHLFNDLDGAIVYAPRSCARPLPRTTFVRTRLILSNDYSNP